MAHLVSLQLSPIRGHVIHPSEYGAASLRFTCRQRSRPSRGRRAAFGGSTLAYKSTAGNHPLLKEQDGQQPQIQDPAHRRQKSARAAAIVTALKAQQTQQTLTQAQQSIQQAVEQPVQRMTQAEADLKAAFARLQQHAVAGGEALMKMLHSLDKPSISLDAKWADMQEQLAGNKDVSDRLQQLYMSSTESAKTVAAMLAESGGSLHRSYWTSSQTKQVIDQEEELRSVVFAQMLGATS